MSIFSESAGLNGKVSFTEALCTNSCNNPQLSLHPGVGVDSFVCRHKQKSAEPNRASLEPQLRKH